MIVLPGSADSDIAAVPSRKDCHYGIFQAGYYRYVLHFPLPYAGFPLDSTTPEDDDTLA